MQIIGYGWEAIVIGLGLLGVVGAIMPAPDTADTEFEIVKSLNLGI